MKSQECPREKNVNGWNRGPSNDSLACEKFKDKTVATRAKGIISAWTAGMAMPHSVEGPNANGHIFTGVDHGAPGDYSAEVGGFRKPDGTLVVTHVSTTKNPPVAIPVNVADSKELLHVAVAYIRKMGWEGSSVNYEARQTLNKLRQLGMSDEVGRDLSAADHCVHGRGTRVGCPYCNLDEMP
jgi:hypothetical protein